MRGVYPSSHEEWDAVGEVGSQITSLETFLSNGINLLGRTIRNIKLLAQFLFILREDIVGCLGVTADTDNLVFRDVSVFEDGGNVAANVVAGGEREELLSGSGDDGFAFVEIDSCRGVGQCVVKEETSLLVMGEDGGLPVMTKVYVILPAAASSLR
jgi:hypothetical protein